MQHTENHPEEQWRSTPEDGNPCRLHGVDFDASGNEWAGEVIPPGAGVPSHQQVDQEACYIVEGTLEVARLGSGGLECFPSRLAIRCGTIISEDLGAWH